MLKCDICHFNNPDQFAYCGRCGNALAVTTTAADAGFISSAIEGERKQVTIIFADISGFTALNDAAKTPADVERVLQIVNHCLRVLSEVVYEYDGYIDKYMGDALMAVFGAPRLHEDDPERALRTALAMVERVEQFNQQPPFPLAEPLGIHIGINTGTVIAGLVGTERKRSYTVMGDAVNVASRLEGVSERGEILVSQSTYHLTQRLFVFKARTPVSVKGKKEPLVIYELLGAREQPGARRGVSGLRSELVGRKPEYDSLQTLLNQLHHGQGAIAVISGEAGMGKSRLIYELARQTTTPEPSTIWLEGRGLSYRQDVNYRLIIEMLRHYLKVGPEEAGEVVWLKLQAAGQTLFADKAADIVPYLALLMGIKLDKRLTQQMPLSDLALLQSRIFEAVGVWIATLATTQMVVLVFEDMHWSDPGSVAVLEYLMTLVNHQPLLLLCVTRPERETSFWQLRTKAETTYPEQLYQFNLEPLTQSQSRSLVDQLLQVDSLPVGLERLILDRAEGNPLFLEEVLRSLIEQGVLFKEDDTWRIAANLTAADIPETLTGVLTARIDRLDEPVKRVLQIASVIGRIFPLSVLRGVTDDVAPGETLNSYLATLMAAELIREYPSDAETEYIFKHVLTHETTYNLLLMQQRRVYHKRIADHMAPMYYMRGEEYARVIAHHYLQGEVWPRALTYLGRAAEAAKTAFDNVKAIDFYNQAHDITNRIPDLDAQHLIKIYLGRGEISARLGRLDEARDDFRAGLALTETDEDAPAANPAVRMRLLGELGRLESNYRHPSQAETYLSQALEIARTLSRQANIVDALNQLGEFETNIGQLTAAQTHLAEAFTLAGDLTEIRRATTSRDGLALIAMHQGRVLESLDEFDRIIDIWRDLGNHKGLMKTYANLAAAYRWQGQYRACVDVCHLAFTLQERTGDTTWAPWFSYFLANASIVQGDFGVAEANIDIGIQRAVQRGSSLWVSMGLAQRGYFRLLMGDEAGALTDAETAMKNVTETGAPLWQCRVKRYAGHIHHLRGNLTQAAQLLAETALCAGDLGYLPDQVDSLVQLGKVYAAGSNWQALEALLAQLATLLVPTEMQGLHNQYLILQARLAIGTGNQQRGQRLLATVQETAATLVHRLQSLEVAHLTRALNPDEAAHQRAIDALLAAFADTIPSPETRTHFERSSVLVKGLNIRDPEQDT